jgi:hypothetical protein
MGDGNQSRALIYLCSDPSSAEPSATGFAGPAATGPAAAAALPPPAAGLTYPRRAFCLLCLLGKHHWHHDAIDEAQLFAQEIHIIDQIRSLRFPRYGSTYSCTAGVRCWCRYGRGSGACARPAWRPATAEAMSDSDSDATAARIATLLSGDQRQRSAAMDAIANVGATEDATATAAACVAPLVDHVLCASSSRVDALEARRAYLLLVDLVWLDPTIVGAEVMGLRGERWLRVWSAPSTALAAAVAKPPEKLTRDDVMLAACGALTFAVTRAKGMTEAATRASMDEMEMFVLWMQNDIHGPAKSSDEASHAMYMKALDILRESVYSDPNSGGGGGGGSSCARLSEIELAALLELMFRCGTQRPAVLAAAVSAKVFDVMVATLQAYPTAEWWVLARLSSHLQTTRAELR